MEGSKERERRNRRLGRVVASRIDGLVQVVAVLTAPRSAAEGFNGGKVIAVEVHKWLMSVEHVIDFLLEPLPRSQTEGLK